MKSNAVSLSQVLRIVAEVAEAKGTPFQLDPLEGYWLKVEAPGRAKVYVSKTDPVREIHVSGWTAPEALGLVEPLARPNGAVTGRIRLARLAVPTERILDGLRTLFEAQHEAQYKSTGRGGARSSSAVRLTAEQVAAELADIAADKA